MAVTIMIDCPQISVCVCVCVCWCVYVCVCVCVSHRQVSKDQEEGDMNECVNRESIKLGIKYVECTGSIILQAILCDVIGDCYPHKGTV